MSQENLAKKFAAQTLAWTELAEAWMCGCYDAVYIVAALITTRKRVNSSPGYCEGDEVEDLAQRGKGYPATNNFLKHCMCLSRWKNNKRCYNLRNQEPRFFFCFTDELNQLKETSFFVMQCTMPLRAGNSVFVRFCFI